MIAKDIIKALNELAPPYLAEKWDNIGLQFGSMDKEVKNVLVALDISPDMIDDKMVDDVDMIITHHPPIFSGLKSITRDDKKGKMIYKLIKNDIVVFTAHTNLDICENGINKVLGDMLGLKDMDILTQTYREKLYKLAIFVPNTHSEEVRNAITQAGGGHIGNYSHCTYNLEGKGTFKPLEGTDPFIGKKGKIEEVEETRIETIVPSDRLKKVINAMKEAHPYEEVAFDVYPLVNDYKGYGHGKVGKIDKKLTIAQFSQVIKEKLHKNDLRIYGKLDKMVSRVAVCGGSGSEFIVDAFKKGADVYVTGDIKYHDAQLASELGISLIDAGHYDTEKHFMNLIKDYLVDLCGDEIKIKTYTMNNFSYSLI